MADSSKPGWIDYLNLFLTAMIGIIGIYVAIVVSQSSDRLNGNGLMLSTATFILDDREKPHNAGVEIYTNLKRDQMPLPAWSDTFIEHFLSDASAPPQSDPTARVETPAPPAASQQVANQLFDALAETTPRLFIEIADEDQRAGANLLRRAVGQVQLGGQAVIAPGVERVTKPPQQIELRVLKKADLVEGGQLADSLSGLLGIKVNVRDLSGTYDTHTNVKRRTYELWFPASQAIAVHQSKS